MRLCEMIPISVIFAPVKTCEVREGAFADMGTELEDSESGAADAVGVADDLVWAPWVLDVCKIWVVVCIVCELVFEAPGVEVLFDASSRASLWW